MNSDSLPGLIRSDYASTHPFAPAALSLTSTTETVISFANTTGPAIVSMPLQTAILGSSTPNDPNANPAILIGGARPGAGYRGSAPYFTSGSFDGRPFLVSASFKGQVVSAAGGASVWIPSLYQGTSSTVGSNNLVFAAGTGISVPLSHTANVSGLIQATLLWDSVSQLLSGEAWSIVQGFDVTASSAITSQYGTRAKFTSISVSAVSGLSFLTTIHITTTAPTSSSTTLTELSISQV